MPLTTNAPTLDGLVRRLVILHPRYREIHQLGLNGKLPTLKLFSDLANHSINGKYSDPRQLYFGGLERWIKLTSVYPADPACPIKINAVVPFEGTEEGREIFYNPILLGLEALKTEEGLGGFYAGVRAQGPEVLYKLYPDKDAAKRRNFQYGYRLGFILNLIMVEADKLKDGVRIFLNADQFPIDTESFNAFRDGRNGIKWPTPDDDGYKGILKTHKKFPTGNQIALDYKANQAGLAIYSSLRPEYKN